MLVGERLGKGGRRQDASRREAEANSRLAGTALRMN